MNPRSLKNLRSWQKGQSGNPGGRPKAVLSDASREWLKQTDPKTGRSNAEMIALALGKRALKGDTGAFCALRDTTEGRPAQAVTSFRYALIRHRVPRGVLPEIFLGRVQYQFREEHKRVLDGLNLSVELLAQYEQCRSRTPVLTVSPVSTTPSGGE